MVAGSNRGGWGGAAQLSDAEVAHRSMHRSNASDAKRTPNQQGLRCAHLITQDTRVKLCTHGWQVSQECGLLHRLPLDQGIQELGHGASAGVKLAYVEKERPVARVGDHWQQYT